MTYRQMVLNEYSNLLPSFRKSRGDQPVFEIILSNNGPVMTLWFVIMLVNIVGMVVLFSDGVTISPLNRLVVRQAPGRGL